MSKYTRIAIVAVPVGILLIILISNIPPVQVRLMHWTAQLQYMLNPPDESVFVPQEQQNLIDIYVTSTLEAALATATPTLPTSTATQTPTGPTATPTNTPTPTLTPTPLPAGSQITDIKFQTQRGLWNYCGPTTLAMSISYWGDEVQREKVGTYLRGGTPEERVDDKNVMLYEMLNYVLDETNLGGILRMGGDLELLKALLAAGYPIVIETHDLKQDVGWLGHYLLIIGYDDVRGDFTTHDAYHGAGKRYSYEEVLSSWRAFNYSFIVTYPPEQEAQVLSVMGPYADDAWATQRALDIALEETQNQTGMDLFYAWFNVGTSYVQQFDYGPASVAYDTAFAIYQELPKSDRPWRMMWYQTGPYFAYFYTARYYDVINLANTTLDAMTKPILEESYYWRGLAREAIGDVAGALEDLQISVNLNPNFGPGWSQLARINQ